MITSSERVRRPRRLRIHLLRRTLLGLAIALVGLSAASSQALAASGTDGTSNTIQFDIASAVLDQTNHRVLVTASAPGGLVAGRHLAGAEVVTAHYTILLENVLVSSVAGKSPSLSLNYAAVGAYTSGRALCMSGMDACLIEEDGIYPPFS